MSDMLSPGKVAELLGLTPGAIRLWLRSGKLNGIKLGSVWRIRRDDLNRLLQAGGAPSPKLKRVPEPLLRLPLKDGRAVSVIDSTDGLLLVAVNGRPKATIQLAELPTLIRGLVE